MMVNQNGDEVVETLIMQGYGGEFDFIGDELGQALCLLAEKLGYSFIRTNATKGGRPEIQLRKDGE